MRCRDTVDLILMLHPGLALAAWVYDDHAVIDLLGVPPHLRRRGLGTMLYQAWERHLPVGLRIDLEAVDHVARAFWLSLGFRCVEGNRMRRIAGSPIDPLFRAAGNEKPERMEKN